MPENAKKPQIRFKGFTDAWEQRKLGDLCSEIGDGLHSAPIYDEKGSYFFINGNNLVNGKIIIDENETKKVSQNIFNDNNKNLDNTTLLLSINGTIGNLAYYQGEQVMLGKSAAYLKCKFVDKTYLYGVLQTNLILKSFMASLTGTTIKNLGLEVIKNTYIFSPKVNEQVKIGKYFHNLDNLITLHQRKLDKLKNIKKSMLEKMFPKNGSNVPEIRFTGFTDAWEQRKLNNYLIVSDEKNSENLYKKEDVLSVSGDFGIVNQIEFQGRSFAGTSVLNYGVVHKGDVVYTKSPLKATPYGIIKTNKGSTGIVSVLYGVYHTKENANADFIQVYFEQNARLNNYLRPLVNKGAKNTLLISDEEALNGEVNFAPSLNEQLKISVVFNSIDNLITLHQRKLEKLQNIKKACLEKMFV